MTAEELKALFDATMERFANREFVSLAMVTLNSNGSVTTSHDTGAYAVPLIGALDIAKDQVKAAIKHGPAPT